MKRNPETALGLDKHDYWRLLRRVYGMGAQEAWTYVQRVGTPPTANAVRQAIAHSKEH